VPSRNAFKLPATVLQLYARQFLARFRAYYRKKIAEGKSRKEALRCLKRHISDTVFKSLTADLQAPSRSAA
jgi:hypothetical protein